MFSKNDYKFNGDLSVNILRKKDTYFNRKIRIHFRPLIEEGVPYIIGVPKMSLAQNVKEVKVREKTGGKQRFIWSDRRKRYGLAQMVQVYIETEGECWDTIFLYIGNDVVRKFDELFLAGDDVGVEKLGKEYF